MRRLFRQPHPGYILLESVAALTILSLGVVAIHGALHQAILSRALAQDYTQARFLLEELVGKLELRPIVQEETRAGSFGGAHSRFRYEWTVSRLMIPPPVVPPQFQSRYGDDIELPVPYLGKISATVSWTRAGNHFQESVETLFDPDRLYVPEETE